MRPKRVNFLQFLDSDYCIDSLSNGFSLGYQKDKQMRHLDAYSVRKEKAGYDNLIRSLTSSIHVSLCTFLISQSIINMNSVKVNLKSHYFE